MNPLPRVDSTDIAHWADRRKAQSDLPRLVRRLIFATAKNLTSVEMPSGESVQSPGWDGLVRSIEGNAFVPEGTSCWEISTSSDVKRKADEDYAKRTIKPLGANPAESTYVFVTARDWPAEAKHKWVAAKKGENVWYDVRAYDADDLEAWLEGAPSVMYPFAIELGKPVTGLQALKSYWEEWRKQTSPAVTKGFVLAGREDACKKTAGWLRSQASSCTLRADTLEEAVVFLASVMESLNDHEQNYFFARCLIVSSVEAWRLVSSHDQPMVLTPSFPDAPVGAAVGNGHHVMVPGDRDIIFRDPDFDLPKLSSYAAADELRKMGFGEKATLVNARLARRSLQAFRRKHTTNEHIRQPAWSKPNDPRAILAAFLAGRWNDANEADQDIVARLADKTYSEVKQELHSLSISSDPPIRSSGSSWYLVSREDSWLLLQRHLNRDFINLLEQSCLRVLGQHDPALELPPEKRWMANAIGHGREHSDLLRRGLADTLAFLGSRCHRGDIVHGELHAGIVQIIYQLLSRANEDSTGKLWVSLDDVMPLVAESDPDGFLDAVISGLKGDPPLLKSLFADSREDDPYGSSDRYLGVMWALESLAWSPDHFSLAIQCLARLAEIDPGGQWANRPFGSLESIFLIQNPQTSDSLEQRLRVLDMLLDKVPVVAWKLLLTLLPPYSPVSHPTRGPVWREWRTETAPDVPQVGWDHAEELITGRIMSFAVDDLEMLIDALDVRTSQNSQLWSMVTERLLSLDTGTISDESLADACLRLRRKLLVIISTMDQLDDIKKERSSVVCQVIDHLTPRNLVIRHAWVFASGIPVPSMIDGKWSSEIYDKNVSEARDKAVRETYDEGGLALLVEMARKVEHPEELGWTLAKLNLVGNAQEAGFLGSMLNSQNENSAQLGAGYVRGRFDQLGWDWAERYLSSEASLWSDAGCALFQLQLPFTFQTWNWVEHFGRGVELDYWSRTKFFRMPDSQHYLHAATKMLELGLPYSAVMTLGIMHGDVGIESQESLVIDALYSAVTGNQQQILDTSTFVHYSVDLLDYLDESEGVEENSLLRLEWAYFPLLDPHVRKSKRLYHLLTHDPIFFAEVVSWAYNSTNASRSQVEIASGLLHGLEEMPCLREDGKCDSEALNRWVENTQQELTKRECRPPGDWHIGIALSYGCEDPDDNVWPLTCIREVLELEQLASQDLKHGFISGIHKKRGTTVRSPFEGGLQERDLAKQYRAHAQNLHYRWPVTASLLRRAAEGFMGEARNEDRRSDVREDLGT